jgi:pimeloyl-ACP methyl ester carboxylesterase/DNA-binding CsgD family transcriptional regulator
LGGTHGREFTPVRSLVGDGGGRLSWSATANSFGTDPVVVVTGWLSHLVMDLESPQIASFYRALAARRRVIRFDLPGVGLSDRAEAQDFGVGRQIEWIRSVVDAAGEDRVSLVVCGLGLPSGLGFAARYPQRVSRIVLLASAAHFHVANSDATAQPSLVEVIGTLTELDWRLGARVMADVLLPDSAAATTAWFTDYQRAAAEEDVAAGFLRGQMRAPVPPLAAVHAPTMVLYNRGSGREVYDTATRFANLLPDARLVIRHGTANLLPFDDVDTTVAEINSFLDPLGSILTVRERQVLVKLTEGLSNRTIARALGITESTAARHIANLFRKLHVNNRAAAVGRAHMLGLAV